MMAKKTLTLLLDDEQKSYITADSLETINARTSSR